MSRIVFIIGHLRSIYIHHARTLFRFISVGIVLIIVDSSIYYISYAHLDFALFISKGLAYCIGVVTSFLLNKFWTFQQKGFSSIEIIKFISLYIVTLVLNVAINQLVFEVTKSLVIAYLSSLSICTLINYIVQRYYIFKNVEV